ncbi:PhzF family phenazine biosynthesis protein [Rhodanobacter sp. FW106-PBR-LB-2-11]|uniref:PhzF family phenazine biosynthesis protein n=1 Tax=Rhodanobacter sp. FW106-PBR-LB-2-11 TaxID=1524463 RepID=UPI0034E483B6
MPTPRRFMQLDVFASRLFDGNPLAVVIDADGLDTTAMQRIAQWTNLSETTFLLPPTSSAADYRVRIFTPRQELPFAGHPSVGSAWVAIEAGLVAAGKTALVQECAAGLLPVQVAGSGAALIRVQAPPARTSTRRTPLHAALARALRIGLAPGEGLPRRQRPALDPGQPGRGPPPCAACSRTWPPSRALCLQQRAVGVGVFGREHAGGAAMAVRAFCPADGIPEDPVTGSANAAIMAWLGERGDRDGYGLRYRASQGREVGRDGIVEVARDLASGAITIGGACAIGVRGDLQLP